MWAQAYELEMTSMHFFLLRHWHSERKNILLKREWKSKILNRYTITLRFINLSVPVCFASVRVEINECSGSLICDINANCQNTPGSYSCSCKQGFYGDGQNCTLNKGMHLVTDVLPKALAKQIRKP